MRVWIIKSNGHPSFLKDVTVLSDGPTIAERFAESVAQTLSNDARIEWTSRNNFLSAKATYPKSDLTDVIVARAFEVQAGVVHF